MSKLRALVVDDDAVIRCLIEDFLYMADFKVDFAENGREGVRMIQKKTYDIIFLDVQMPGVNGEQVMKVLTRGRERLPIVIISGHLTRDQLFRLKNLGAQAFLAKPFDSDTFFKAVGKVTKGEQVDI